MRPYAHTVLSVIADIAVTQRVAHPLLSVTREPKKILLVVLSSDRGLCGAFNGNVNKFTEKFYRENKKNFDKVDFLFVGRRAADYFRRRNIQPIDTIMNLARDVSYDLASNVAERLMEAYKTGEYDEIRLIYNEFKSVIAQDVVCETILPIDIKTAATLNKGTMDFPQDMIFEPKPDEIIDQLITKHFNVQVYRCMSESVASEHGARMTAMENATKNAGEMIHSLTLTYNKLRQASITTELIEITSGAEALKG
jgi:F-type H+-transporting ATPase subunit gamma